MMLDRPSQKPGVLILRPEPEAADTARRVADLGWTPFVSPLLRIEPESEPLPESNWNDGWDGLVITSPRALAAAIPTGKPLFVVGDRTAARLRAQGHPIATVAPDAASLATAIAAMPNPPRRLLHLSGEHVAIDLAACLKPHTQVKRHVVYRAVEQPLNGEARTALAEGSVETVLLTSPRIATLLVAQIDPIEIPALALSPAVAKAWPGRAKTAARPDIDALLECLGPAQPNPAATR